jgi:RecJ-like exonuclease
MTDRLLTISDRSRPAPPPGLFELRVLERTLRERIARLDARVDELLHDGDPSDARTVADIDVLCAAIAEAQELVGAARREAALHTARHHARRRRPRRWA